MTTPKEPLFAGDPIEYRGEAKGVGEAKGIGAGSEGVGPEADSALRFEEALERLEALVRELESGNLPLEVTISRFEEGQKLLRTCNDLLARAELKVKEVLRQADGSLGLGNWEGENGGDLPG